MYIARICTAAAAFALLATLGQAQAAGGYSVTQAEARTVSAGMSSQDVQQRLGRPFSDVKYANEPGPVWLYYVTDAIDRVFFEISFGADGKVAGTSQYVDPRVYTGK